MRCVFRKIALPFETLLTMRFLTELKGNPCLGAVTVVGIIIFYSIIYTARGGCLWRMNSTNFVLLFVMPMIEICLVLTYTNVDPEDVIASLDWAAMVLFGSVIFAFRTYDSGVHFTFLSDSLTPPLLVLLIVFTFTLAYPEPLIKFAISCSAVILSTLYVNCDLQSIFDTTNLFDQHKFNILLLNIFLDVINLFVFILNIIHYYRTFFK